MAQRGGTATVTAARPKAPLSCSRFLGAASRAHDAADLPAAITLYTTAIQLDPTCVSAWIGRGVAHKEQRQFDRAVDDYSRALQLSPSDSVTLLVLSNRANVHSALGDSAAALVDHNSALALNRHDPVLWANRGSTLLRLGRVDDARADFEAALRMDNSYAVAWYNLGLCHGRQGAIRACVDDFTRAARLFEQSKFNQSHAQDCYRQIQLFTGADARSVTGSARGNVGAQNMSVEITPISPSHSKGITRTNGAVMSAASSSPSVTPAGTPSSRRRFQSPGEVASDAFDTQDLAAATLSASSIPLVAMPTPLIDFQSAPRSGRDGRSLEQEGAFSFARSSALQSGRDEPAAAPFSARSNAAAASSSSAAAAASSTAASAAPVYALARPASLLSTTSTAVHQTCVAPSQSPVRSTSHSNGYAPLGPSSPRSADSINSPDSFDPLLSPLATGHTARKKHLPPVKPNVTHVRPKAQQRALP